MATRIVAPGGAPTHPQGAGKAPRAVYSPEQTRQALRYITAKADTLSHLLMQMTQEVENIQHEYRLHACEALAEMIAAAADTALNGECKGGFEDWIYGADFGKAGAA
ncbi:hypothetical protein GCM10007320_61510 [Pseudorhodoferax aquiterrae]|uniref:Uncharacterized protein n=1 Tax=Pseudorhodoferax aquiterrae TaxID=747304 RepID=A0ABQ3GE55_9BURK|nr:hypothetical protein [Pseudorhodoferax aquiterrae]GHD02342.1 hypothetical protein GCM10007320_61510 [Pseudorhodoferax aquiterrae]